MYGPAVRCKRTFNELADVRSCINVSGLDWSLLCSGPSWVSARVRSHYRKGLNGPFGSPVFACAREDRSSISFLILSQTSAGKAFQLLALNHAA
jgi:hypothetical protein